MTTKELQQKSVQYRKKILHYIKKANAGHTAGSLSCIDILNVLYNGVLNVSPETFSSPERDRYIQSKGHSVEALYVVLADQGFFPEKELDRLGQYQSHFVGHPTRKIPGIEHNTGALGHGLSFAAGVALAGKRSRLNYRVFTLLGDGELAEGSNWEALMLAAHYQLDNLIAIVDHNRLQITGRVNEVCNIYPLKEKFEAFGWAVRSINGHDVDALQEHLSGTPFDAGKPSLLLANTVKGRGISFMEDVKAWHHKVPNDGQYDQAIQELEKTLKNL